MQQRCSALNDKKVSAKAKRIGRSLAKSKGCSHLAHPGQHLWSENCLGQSQHSSLSILLRSQFSPFRIVFRDIILISNKALNNGNKELSGIA
jgi:hypothetical protein